MNLRETWRQFIILFEVSSTYDIFMRFFIFSSFAIGRMHARIRTHLQIVYVFSGLSVFLPFYLSSESVCAVYRLCVAQSITPSFIVFVCLDSTLLSFSFFSYFGGKEWISFTFIRYFRPLVRRICCYSTLCICITTLHYIRSCLSIFIRFLNTRNSVSLLSRDI